ncbi:hypothetical protein A2U01_0083210, partial [Trifolium medium]|nr:hypothetical protein [Trifolium medium]
MTLTHQNNLLASRSLRLEISSTLLFHIAS